MWLESVFFKVGNATRYNEGIDCDQDMYSLAKIGIRNLRSAIIEELSHKSVASDISGHFIALCIVINFEGLNVVDKSVEPSGSSTSPENGPKAHNRDDAEE